MRLETRARCAGQPARDASTGGAQNEAYVETFPAATPYLAGFNPASHVITAAVTTGAGSATQVGLCCRYADTNAQIMLWLQKYNAGFDYRIATPGYANPVTGPDVEDVLVYAYRAR
jgi:hypothetical protein